MQANSPVKLRTRRQQIFHRNLQGLRDQQDDVNRGALAAGLEVGDGRARQVNRAGQITLTPSLLLAGAPNPAPDADVQAPRDTWEALRRC
jgi:hypothetical protein